jgi:hypothetical protein
VYRGWHRLDAPASEVPPLLSICLGRAWRSHRLPNGIVVRFGDRYGELHLDNAHVVALRERGRSSIQLGLEFRRELRASLTTLARLTGGDGRFSDGRFSDVVAFSAITIFHQGLLTRLGFEVEPDGLLAPRVTSAYQYALLLSLSARPGVHRSLRAQRLWISRAKLRALYEPLRRVS